MQHFNYNGKIFEAGEAVVGPGNRGLRYGDGLFETMKLSNGRIILSNEHYARLWNGMKLLHFQFPKWFTPERLMEEMFTLARKNGHLPAARIRLNVFRGDGGLYDAESHQPHYCIETWKLEENHGVLNSNGLVLGIYEEVQKNCDILSNLKHNNFLPYVMAAFKVKEEKWNDALLMNQHERVCETTLANIFLIRNGAVITPCLSEGCVAGVMRGQVISLLKEYQFNVEERPVDREELMVADEIFLTNSIRNIYWVGSYGNKTYGHQLIQKIYSLLIPTIS